METKEIRDVANYCLTHDNCSECDLKNKLCGTITNGWLLSLCDEVERLRLLDIWSKAPDEADKAVVQYTNGRFVCGTSEFKRKVKNREREIAEKYADTVRGELSLADIIEAAIIEAKK